MQDLKDVGNRPVYGTSGAVLLLKISATPLHPWPRAGTIPPKASRGGSQCEPVDLHVFWLEYGWERFPCKAKALICHGRSK